MMDMDRNGVRAQFIVDAVELFLQYRLGDDPAGTPHEMLEDGALAPRQDQHGLADAQVAADRIEGDVAGLQQGAERALRSAQQRLDAGDDFAHGKRLDQVVVGASVEARHAMLHGVTRRQHQDGKGVAPGAHVLQENEPVAVGQPEIEDDGIVGVDLEGRARIAAAAHRIDGKAGPRQRRAQDLGDANLVLDHQESHVHYLLLGPATR